MAFILGAVVVAVLVLAWLFLGADPSPETGTAGVGDETNITIDSDTGADAGATSDAPVVDEPAAGAPVADAPAGDAPAAGGADSEAEADVELDVAPN
ncbi:hypothetical protein RM543_18640 [Roseicyclus sp. F158]|uniref:Dynamin n=1 Tax=Tropicimonas omnivorans TaxID=3075590 RepID=A0ABU3DLT1_9RHOB|nr:hypothetical protein [Roseicyclus sp. F158]MDT0684684.1 hypothetical protein [Roseicyclus sp. F158]